MRAVSGNISQTSLGLLHLFKYFLVLPLRLKEAEEQRNTPILAAQLSSNISVIDISEGIRYLAKGVRGFALSSVKPVLSAQFVDADDGGERRKPGVLF